MRVVTMTVLAAMLAAIGVSGTSHGADYVSQFELFKKTHKREYPTASEEAKRLGYFVRNMERAAELQAVNPHARFGANEYSDLSEEEFKTRHNSEAHYRAAVRARQGKESSFKTSGTFASSKDWRSAGVVTPVKNQGQCGSCWSFSTTGNIEGQWAMAGNKLVSLSEQELVSCDKTSNGCQGGLMDLAFEWLVSKRQGGITAESQYPYVSGSGSVPACDMSGKTDVAWIQGHHDLPHDEKSMAEWLSTGGPVSIAVDAKSWQSYQGGVMTNCQATKVDHGVLAVGYDMSAQPPYWIIKNSWGPGWGEQGYIRVEFGQNECLITTVPSSSVAAGSHPPAPPSPPTPPGPPSPPSPSTGSFTQYVCSAAFCLSGCEKHTFQTGVCLSMSGGGSAIATCGSELEMKVYSSSDCSGSAQTESQPLNKCVEDESGSYLYNTCSSSTAAMKSASNVTRMRRH